MSGTPGNPPIDPAGAARNAEPAPGDRRRWEFGVFLSVVMIVIPLLTIGTIALYALGVWIFQMLIAGPPGPIAG